MTGLYREARLYSIEPGGQFVLVVQLPSGALQRFPLSAAERGSLGLAIDAAMRAAGRPSAEAMSDFVSEPAGNAFARHQTFLAAAVYGPLAASLADDGAAAGGIYLATTGTGILHLLRLRRRTRRSPVRRAISPGASVSPRPRVEF